MKRQIGPWGTLARIGIGAYFLVEAAPVATVWRPLFYPVDVTESAIRRRRERSTSHAPGRHDGEMRRA